MELQGFQTFDICDTPPMTMAKSALVDVVMFNEPLRASAVQFRPSGQSGEKGRIAEVAAWPRVSGMAGDERPAGLSDPQSDCAASRRGHVPWR